MNSIQERILTYFWVCILKLTTETTSSTLYIISSRLTLDVKEGEMLGKNIQDGLVDKYTVIHQYTNGLNIVDLAPGDL